MKSPKDKKYLQNKKSSKDRKDQQNKINRQNNELSKNTDSKNDLESEQDIEFDQDEDSQLDTESTENLCSKNLIKKQNKSKSGFKRLALFTLGAIAAALIIFIAGMVYIYSITPPDSHGTFVDSIRFMVSPGQTAFQGKDKMIILCLGVDQNWTDRNIMYTKNARTDTIFLISIDSKAEEFNVLSIPRDTWVQLSETQGSDKINAAYAYGGIKQAKKCIENFLGINIDHYVLLKVRTTENMVNAIGGIEVYVEKDMNYDDNWGHLHVHLKKGLQVLNGQQSVGYARFRHDEESDWGRIRRQQQVINALIKEFRKPANLLRMDKIAKVIHEGIDTDMTLTQLLDLARLYKEFDRKNMKTGVIKGDDALTDDGVSYIKPNEEEKNALVRKLLLRDSSIDPSQIRVGILNGSGIEGSAIKLADILGKKGYKIIRVADADRKDYACTKLIDHLNDRKLASTLDDFAGPNEYVSDEEKKDGQDEDFTIIIGRNWAAWQESKNSETRESPQSNADYRYGNKIYYGNKVSTSPDARTNENPDYQIKEAPYNDPMADKKENTDIDVKDDSEKIKTVEIPAVKDKIPSIENVTEKPDEKDLSSKPANKRDFPNFPTPQETGNIPNIPNIPDLPNTDEKK